MDKSYEIRIRGIVQGVGFRPFVFQAAVRHRIRGSVLNDTEGVIVRAEGEEGDCAAFISELANGAPPLSLIMSVDAAEVPPSGAAGFVIGESRTAEGCLGRGCVNSGMSFDPPTLPFITQYCERHPLRPEEHLHGSYPVRSAPLTRRTAASIHTACRGPHFYRCKICCRDCEPWRKAVELLWGDRVGGSRRLPPGRRRTQ